MTFNCPLSIEKAKQIIGTFTLDADSKVIDFGCGEGEFLSMIHDATKANCLGVDVNSSCVEAATKKAAKKTSTDKLTFLQGDAQELDLKKNSYDLAICIGATQAFGIADSAYPNALQKMSELVKPNGSILVGEGYWKRKPDQEYLDFIGEPTGIYNNHEQNILQAESHDLVPFYVTISNQDEWDHFEWSFRQQAEHNAISDPDNLLFKEKLLHIRKWNKYYREFGRTTMGFGFYLFSKPNVKTTI